MKDRRFDWFDYHGVDEDRIKEDSSELSLFERVFGIVSLAFFILFCATFSFNLFLRYTMGDGLYIYGIDVVWYNQAIMIFTGSFRFTLFGMFFILTCVQKLSLTLFTRALEVSYRFFTISIWMTMYLLEMEVTEDQYYKQACVCVILLSAVYGLLAILLMLFEESYIESVMRERIRKTNKTEEIVRALKGYAYDMPINIPVDHPESSSPGGTSYTDISGLISYWILYNGHTQLKCFSQVDNPELWSLRDALRLARDVFLKAVPGGSEMGYNDLRSIFSSSMFESAKQYIDIYEDKTIKKKEFRGIVAGFYYHRLSLAKSIKSQTHFVRIVKRLACVPVSILLLITCLVIFGIDIKELFALLVSSAIVVHFTGSPIVKDLWKGLMFVLSHRFDVGDEIVVSGEEMTVARVGVISSSFILNNGGVTKMFNSELIGKSIVNMTCAPKNLLVFNFDLPSMVMGGHIEKLRCRISEYVRHRLFEFHDSFSVVSAGPDSTEINKLKTAVILKCKNSNSKSKNYMLRAEFNSYLNRCISEILASGTVESSDTGCGGFVGSRCEQTTDR